jgi:hypothetical protein
MTGNADVEALKSFQWSIQDEAQFEFIAIKYGDRKKLYDEYHEKRKLADKSETINGKPNLHHPRMLLEADVAQMRWEMAYLLSKNKELEERTQILSGLYERVSILEGAYNFLTMGFENAKKKFSEALLMQVSVHQREQKLKQKTEQPDDKKL